MSIAVLYVKLLPLAILKPLISFLDVIRLNLHISESHAILNEFLGWLPLILHTCIVWMAIGYAFCRR